MACCLFGVNPLSKPIITCQLVRIMAWRQTNLGNKFFEIWIMIWWFLFKKMQSNISARWLPFCSDLKVWPYLTHKAFPTEGNKQRVLMHRHQGWNVRHGLCHIYMRYLYIYELFIAFVCFVVCSLLQRDGIFGVLCRKWQARESTGMFGNLMAIYYIMPQFIQNHSRFVMLMKTCMIS